MEKLKIEKIGEKLEAEDIDLESLTMLKEDDLKVCIRSSNLERFYFLFFYPFLGSRDSSWAKKKVNSIYRKRELKT